MSTPDAIPGRSGGVKTLAIRLEPELHAQLSLIAQLTGSTITDEIRAAIESHIETVKANPELSGRADSVLAAIEREAAARRDAIAALFGSADGSTASTSTAPERPTRPRRSGSGD